MDLTARKIVRNRLRRGFSLTELLIVITIIAMLGAISLGVLGAAQDSACRASTRATIAKLNEIIMNRYESYQNRRVEMLDHDNNLFTPEGISPIHWAEARLDAVRDLMRMEMPDRYNDITDPPILFNPDSTAQKPWGKINPPALQIAYNNETLAAKARAEARGIDFENLAGRHGPAECLYLIVMQGSPESRHLFKESEVGDTDGDGLPEFLDGWGRPIYFIRWAPGYTDTSPIQHADPEKYHDPLDPMHVDNSAYRLIPLIYSAGPDGVFDLKVGTGSGYHFDGNPYNGYLGTPYDGDNSGHLDHLDNITNHDVTQ